ncbi:type II and III secretion system protein [Betaproteobacteria bacterium]|nr:type II and III secretion system protein [Betaproteobacteria bacterium]GHU12020.1 type II and III secretion system protein [Betaproteobacteria bacterium]GHU17494.1 type II and III secretion system protein [Betaproteobacteria bacterium]
MQFALAVLALLLAAACTPVARPAASAAPLFVADNPLTTAPKVEPPVTPPAAAQPPALPKPDAPTYSLDVRQVPVDQLLSALARDARLDLDLLPGVDGLVTLTAFKRPLGELLERITSQAGLRYVLEGAHLVVMPDTPFLRAYRVDYVNLARNMEGAVATSTQIATSPSGVEGQRQTGSGNTSLTRIETRATNHFWESLEANVRALLREHERYIRQPECEALPRNLPAALTHALCASSDDAAFVMSNRETGVLMVRATGRQHQQVADFIDLVQGAARRQVVVEATIVEVTLSDGYRQGIDWNRLAAPAIHVAPRGANDATTLTPTVTYLSNPLDIKLDWLETFGTVKVLSSPRLAVLNNQTAMLKVVEEVVYFLVDASTTNYGGSSEREKITATTTPQSVSVGLVMALTPQIGRDGDITLSVRPTISSISGFRDDPNPSLGSIPNRVPQIRTREIESVLRLNDGEIAILGGLMEDRVDYDTGRIPLLGALPVLGELFTRRDNSVRRTELVIFLRPRLINSARPELADAGMSAP